MPMHDFRCPACCRVWEQNVPVTSKGVLRPRCSCGRALGEQVWLRAPGIRTNDNGPRDMRVLSTGGHPVEGQTTQGRKAWDTQLGKWTEGLSAREIERECAKRGIEIVTEKSYTRSHLSYEPPPPRLEDDPAALREAEEEAADTWDQAAAGKLPPLEHPLLDEDAEGREAATELATEAAPVAQAAAEAVEGA